MTQISAAAVNELRKKTDLPLMECKKALMESEGDMEKAIDLLRSWNAKAGLKRESNETAEGRIGIYVDPALHLAAIVEMRCESAPSAKSDQFIELCQQLAEHVARHHPASVEEMLTQPYAQATVKDRIDEVVGLIREKMVLHRFTRLESGHFGQYLHHDGTVGALIQCTGDRSDDEILRDVCAHIAAMNPEFMVPDEIPADKLNKEKEIILNQIKEDPKNENKPANILEKISEGKIKTWMSEIVLTEQPMANSAKYPNQTVGATLAKLGLTIQKFVRYRVGGA